MMLHFWRCRRAGFTLIEIMVVIAIIAILAGIVVPNIMMARFEAGLSACHENCKLGVMAFNMARTRNTLKQAVKMLSGAYYSDNGQSIRAWGYVNGLVANGYLSRNLSCPVCRGAYQFDFECRQGLSLAFYRDWQKTKKVQIKGCRCIVYCISGHKYGGVKRKPCYDDNMGAGFDWD